MSEDYNPEDYQGRTQKQQDSNEAVAAMSAILFVGAILIIGLFKLMGWPL